MATWQATRLRRETQIPKTYELKIKKSKLNKAAQNALKMFFLEAKWLYNHIVCLKGIEIFEYSTTGVKEIPVKVKDKFEIRPLKHLSAQMRQSVLDVTKQNIKSVVKLNELYKKLGKKLGHLKPKSEINVITLKQPKVTLKIITRNKIKIHKIKQKIWVNGLDQIPKDAEMGMAKIQKRHNDYYIRLTCWLPKEQKIPRTDEAIGLDFGIKTPITLSNGIQINHATPITKKLKLRHRQATCISKPSKQKKKKPKKPKRKHKNRPPPVQTKKQKKPRAPKKTKWSKRHWKAKIRLQKEYDHLTNQRKDKNNKIIHGLTSFFTVICFQRDSIAAWQASKRRGWARKLQTLSLGRIIADLRRRLNNRSHMLGEVEPFFPSSKTCYQCGHTQPMPLEERIYVCGNPDCDWVCDRDENAALNIKGEGLRVLSEMMIDAGLGPLPMERRNVKLGEMGTATIDLLEYLNAIPGVEASPVREPRSYL